jgi:hypothetical protein
MEDLGLPLFVPVLSGDFILIGFDMAVNKCNG